MVDTCYVCMTCGREYKCESELEAHAKQYHERGSFPCNVCKVILSTRGERCNHRRIHQVKRKVKHTENVHHRLREFNV